MSEKTKIEWCQSSWNPITGCLHGCAYCYAQRIAERFGCHIKGTQEKYDLSEPHKVDGNRVPYPYDFAPTFHRYRLGDYAEKEARTIFVCSMADMFGNWVPDEWIERVFEACEKAPQHQYIFLTKNPERYTKLSAAGKLPQTPNMWYGTTITTDEKPFFDTSTYNSFLSIEPLQAEFSELECPEDCNLRWIIIGAETGRQKGKIVPEKAWIDGICKSADKANIPVFMKDSLVPIVGEENMRREFPEALDYRKAEGETK